MSMPLVDLPEHDLTNWPFWYTGAVGVCVREKCQKRMQRTSRNQRSRNDLRAGNHGPCKPPNDRQSGRQRKGKNLIHRSNSKRRPILPMHRLSLSTLRKQPSFQPTTLLRWYTLRGSFRTRFDLLVLLFQESKPRLSFWTPSVTIQTARIRRHLTNQGPEPLFANLHPIKRLPCY